VIEIFTWFCVLFAIELFIAVGDETRNKKMIDFDRLLPWRPGAYVFEYDDDDINFITVLCPFFGVGDKTAGEFADQSAEDADLALIFIRDNPITTL